METRATRLTLLSRVRNPDDGVAWREFEQRYADLILRYALARRLQFADAEDVRQIVFLRLSKYLRTFVYTPQRGRFRSYLGAIVRNVIADRAHCPAGRTLEVDEGSAGEPADPRAAESDEQWQREWVSHHCRLALEQIRRTFDPQSVEVFQALLAGETADDVAQRRGLSADAVAKIRQRVRARMQELIRAQVAEEDAE